ncbi:Pentatricopeptide repeat-containing protein [Acorus gramineus]|uniref:Pentatricopeptide repeat-containing protein n=1 Tax=Acorus gramineus TaxID=55184 RepID=A0AAV9B3N6_ACOGR|nr:Pentatricopeptide repeat-containing protein [Acorus gramineus]
MEKRGVRAEPNTYFWLLEGCLNNGSLLDAKRVHSRILKSGFNGDRELGDRLLRVYVGLGDMWDALKLFDDMSHRSIESWNCLISGWLANKAYRNALGVFLRSLGEGGGIDRFTFSSGLKACGGCGVSFDLVRQIHAKIVRYGYASNLVVGNPLIDLYSKNGRVESARLVFDELGFKDSVSWVAMLSGFSQNGLAEEAMRLFVQMRCLGVMPTPYVISSVLSACMKSEAFELGRQVQGQIYKWGFMSETFVGNALITLYSRWGNLRAAEQVFREMDNLDGVTYNSLISGHAQRGDGNVAIRFFKEMYFSGFKPDTVTVASLLSACAFIGALEKGKQLHSYVVKSGFSSDMIIEGSLLDLYVKCADIETSRELFNSTNKENVVLWNVMLVAYGQMGDLPESFKLFSQMKVAGVQPNEYTYPSIIRTCTSFEAIHLGEQIHSQIVKTGFDLSVYVSSVLIDMYAKCGRLGVAHDILERLTEEDVVSWTAMIAGYAQHELYIEALSLFREMQVRGIRSDHIGLSSALSACSGIQAMKQGLQIHAQAVISGYSMDLSIGNALISLYARCGMIQEAYSAFEAMEDKDEVSWNGLISGFAQSGQCEEALKVFVKMNQVGVRANVITYAPLVSASANLADVKQGKQIHARIIKSGHDLETETGNALVTLYSKCGIIKDAKREFFEMSDRNEVTWNAMITGYSQHGFGREALELFEDMKRERVKPNHITFIAVLCACSHVGLVDEGLKYFKSINEEHNLIPRLDHYACVVDMLGRAGQLDRARAFIEEMPIVPNAMVWRTLLSACRVHKNIEIGEFAAQRLLELEPNDSANYVLISNIYAVARRWDNRDKIRLLMKNRGVKKEPGRSWIEVDNSVHAFFVGDRLHPLSDKIYAFLEELNDRATEIGYVQDHNSFLHDIEQEQKDPTAYIHSEKLAVAFGLISLSSTMPIRVIKNLRVCNDCHNWMKFVSRIAKRTVVVRDTYRFHHFEGGFCSCKDYW